jgi:hypothetical protein
LVGQYIQRSDILTPHINDSQFEPTRGSFSTLFCTFLEALNVEKRVVGGFYENLFFLFSQLFGGVVSEASDASLELNLGISLARFTF